MADGTDSSSDESLNATSEKFDPLKALYSPKTRVPSVTAPIYDNLNKYESVAKGISFPGKKGSNNNAKAEVEEYAKRRFLPHQEPLKRTRPGRGNDVTRSRNVLTKMERTFGPLGALYQYMQSRTRVKIYTRNERGIRGHVEAYVVAFDKHWNLALEDCFEVWTRKVKRKAPALGPPESVKLPDDIPRTVVKESNGKIETLERHVTQLLLRGEQIAIIMKID